MLTLITDGPSQKVMANDFLFVSIYYHINKKRRTPFGIRLLSENISTRPSSRDRGQPFAIRSHVFGPHFPSTASPFFDWNRLHACSLRFP